MNTPQHSQHDPQTQLSSLKTENDSKRPTIGILTSETEHALQLLSLEQIEKFVERNVNVLVQRGLGESQQIPDYLFTEHGADIMEDAFPLILFSNIVLKYDTFTADDLFLLKHKQIIISHIDVPNFTNEMAQFIQEKKITAVGLNFLQVLPEQLQSVVKQLVNALIFTPHVRNAVRINPLLLKSVYAYQGEICQRNVAEAAQVPWKDLVELCWHWN